MNILSLHKDPIEAGNKLIANFVGRSGKLRDTLYTFKGISDLLEDDIWYTIEQSKFHKCWNWLMLVVDKIEKNHKANFKTICSWNEFNGCSYYQVVVNIEKGTMSKDNTYVYDQKKVYEHSTQTYRFKKKATYEAVIEFIKWYNKQN